MRPWEDDDNAGIARAALSLFGVGSLVFLALTVVSYLGLGAGGSPRIPARSLVRMQQVGYYARASADGSAALTFTGDPIRSDAIDREGFRIPALGPGQRVRVTAKGSGGTVSAWQVETAEMDTPVRLEGRCVNAIPGGWLKSEEQVDFLFRPAKDEPERFMRLKLEPASEKLKISYSDGAVAENGTISEEAGHAAPISRGLNEGARLTYLLDAGTLTSRWTGKTSPLALQAGADVDPWSVLSRVSVVRERRGDSHSSIGLLVDPGLEEMGVRVLRNGAPLDLQASAPPLEIPVTAAATLAFGLTGARRFALTLPNRLDTTGGSARLVADFEVPSSYTLPPLSGALEKPFLITSGRDMVPLDGYAFPTGNDNHPLYAKAVVNGDATGITVQDGVSRQAHPDDERIFLGDPEQGIVTRLHLQKPAILFAGRWAVAALAGLAVLFCVGLWWRALPVGRGDVAWVFLWIAAVALVVVRLLLAYRCSLLPPDDTSLADLASFHKALRVSLAALFILPSAMVLVRLRYVPLARQRKLAPLRARLLALPHERLCLYLSAAAALIPILARVAGSRDDLLGVRTSIWVHLLLVAGLASFAAAVARRQDLTPIPDKPTLRTFCLWHRRGLLGYVLLNALALAMLVLAIGDNGSLIYGLSIGLALLVGALPFRTLQAHRKRQGVSGVLVFSLGLALLVAIAAGMNIRFFVQRFETFNGTIAYRFASLDDMDPEMLLNPRRTEFIEATQYRNNRDQQWQMLLYAAVGASDKNPGYGGAALSKVALKYPTSMTDTTYAVYLLGEFGPWAGAWTTALYLVFLAACFAGAASVRRDGSWAFVPLVGIGAFFAVNGLYMAAADVGSVPFTGQNLPLLSLYSVADVVQCLVVLVLASAYLTRQSRGANMPPKSGDWLPTAFGVASGLAWIGIVRAGVGMPEKFAEDLDAPAVLREVVRRVETRQVALGDDLHIDPKSVAGLTPIEKEAIREFNLRPDKSDPEAGLFYVEPNAAGGFDLQVNRAFFHLTSPYRRSEGVPWRHSILARNAGGTPRLYMLTSPLSLSLNSGGYPAIAWIDSSEPVRGANAAILAARSRYGRIDFAEYRRRRIAGKTVVTLKPRLPQGMPKGHDWGVYVEGQPVPDAGRELSPDDLISIEDRTGRAPRRYNMIYLGDQPEPLAFVRWRNGAYRRALPGGPSFGLAANLGRVGDDVRPAHDLSLTLDLDLHQRLQDAIRRWCLAQPPRSDLGWRLNDPEESKPVSMTLIDTFSGDVLALPSFPHADPNGDDFAEDIGRSGPIRRSKLLRNWNFENHVIGSTIKPLTFATMSSRLYPKYRLEDAVVHTDSLTHEKLGGIPLNEETAPYPPVGDISMSQFLTQSRTWPACVIGALGLVESTADYAKVLVPDSANPDITLGGGAYRINLLNSPDRIVSPDPRRNTWVPRTNLSDTLLFTGLAELFGIQTPPNKTTEAEAIRLRTASFLPSLLWTDVKRMPTYVSEVVPRRVLYECDSMRSVKQELLTTLIGGAQSQWNNVAMAESFARLCTGRRVSARLEAGSAPSFAPMPKPLDDASWREQALLGPLEQVHITGTARSLTVDFKGFRAVMKTGTLGEKVDSESLMFTVGRFQAGAFVPGETVTGYFFMRDTNTGGHMLKFSLADQVLPIVVDYLTQRSAKVPSTRDGRSKAADTD